MIIKQWQSATHIIHTVGYKDLSMSLTKTLPRTTANRSATDKSATKARMNFRLAPEIKERVALAASITGQEMTDFAVAAISERADEIISRHTTIHLSEADHEFFLRALEHQKAPSKRARTAAAKYRKIICKETTRK